MKEGRIRPSLLDILRGMTDSQIAAMKEGRIRPSLDGLALHPVGTVVAAMKEGRIRPSLVSSAYVETTASIMPQ